MNNQFQTFIIFLLLIIGLSACSNSDNSKHYLVSNKNLGHLSIKTPKYSFGVVKKSLQKKVHCSFLLENTGSRPVTIHKIDVSCGCISVREYTKTITPNASGILDIEVNVTNLKGYFNKVVFVNSDADNTLELLRIKGNIEE